MDPYLFGRLTPAVQLESMPLNNDLIRRSVEQFIPAMCLSTDHKMKLLIVLVTFLQPPG